MIVDILTRLVVGGMIWGSIAAVTVSVFYVGMAERRRQREANRR